MSTALFVQEAFGEEAITTSFLFLGILIILGITLLVNLVVCALLYICFDAVPEQHRTMNPALVWLLLIPLFNYFWNFKVFPGISESYENALRAQGQEISPQESGRSLGMWYCGLVLASFIPCVGGIASLAALVMLILFLVKAFGLKGRLDLGAGGDRGWS